MRSAPSLHRSMTCLALLIGVEASADDVLEERADPRLRAGVSAVLVGGVGGAAAAIGPGLAGDLGLVVEDRVALGLRASFGTSVIMSIGSAGLFVEYALNDHANVGLGAALTAFHPIAEDLASAVAGLVPPGEPVQRFPYFAMAATAGVGYAWF